MAACAAVAIDRRDLDRTVVLDVDLGAGDLDDLANHLAARADHFADLVLGDVDDGDARRVAADRVARRRSIAFAISSRMCMRPSRACASAMPHDLLGDRGDLDVHLQARSRPLGAGDFEVHVAEMILVAEDV